MHATGHFWLVALGEEERDRKRPMHAFGQILVKPCCSPPCNQTVPASVQDPSRALCSLLKATTTYPSLPLSLSQLPCTPMACLQRETSTPARTTTPQPSPRDPWSNPSTIRPLSGSSWPRLAPLCKLTRHRTPGVRRLVVFPPSRPALTRLVLSPQAPSCSPSLPGAARAPPLSHASVPCAARGGQCASSTQHRRAPHLSYHLFAPKPPPLCSASFTLPVTPGAR
jgi:hypothetical protein